MHKCKLEFEFKIDYEICVVDKTLMENIYCLKHTHDHQFDVPAKTKIFADWIDTT